MVIDDDDMLRSVLSQTLAREGYEVVEAADGSVGVKLFQARAVDLVITDLLMPEKEGLETIGELRKIDPDVKIIAMSGGGRCSPSDLLPIARRLGASECIAKPFSRTEILDLVHDVLGEKPTR
jgi:DNA-binding NtrC family response regulator